MRVRKNYLNCKLSAFICRHEYVFACPLFESFQSYLIWVRESAWISKRNAHQCSSVKYLFQLCYFPFQPIKAVIKWADLVDVTLHLVSQTDIRRLPAFQSWGNKFLKLGLAQRVNIFPATCVHKGADTLLYKGTLKLGSLTGNANIETCLNDFH